MDSISDQRSYTEYSLESIGTRTQVCDRTQIFKTVTFFLQRIIRCGLALYCDLSGLDLKRLFCIRRGDQCTADDNSSPDIQTGQCIEVFHRIGIYNLDGLKKCTIVYHKETKVFGSSVVAYPATNLDFFVIVALSVSVDFSDGC